MLPPRVTVVEVGPRDGLQNESVRLATADRVEFVDRLTAASPPVIEVGAFVSPRWVPQMADTAAVFAGIRQRSPIRYSALVPNLVGLDSAHAAGVREVAVLAAASDAFSRRNINSSVAESLETYAAVCARARELGIRVRGYLSTAFGCPFEGEVPVARVTELAAALLRLGVFEVAVSDTIGIAHPGQVTRVAAALAETVPLERVAFHFHDTRGTGLANVLAALHVGISTFDASCGGLGGCPYAPGAAGNLATEDLIYMLHGLGIATGVDLAALLEASRFIESRLEHPLPSRYFRAVARSRTASSP